MTQLYVREVGMPIAEVLEAIMNLCFRFLIYTDDTFEYLKGLPLSRRTFFTFDNFLGFLLVAGLFTILVTGQIHV